MGKHNLLRHLESKTHTKLASQLERQMPINESLLKDNSKTNEAVIRAEICMTHALVKFNIPLDFADAPNY